MRRLLPVLLLACAEAPPPADDDVVEAPPEPLRFAFPVRERDRIGPVIGVDHDPATGEGLAGRAACVDHAGRRFPACYDGHDGTDFLLIGGFAAMDAGSATVIAAADGVVVEAHDGEYDRCHASLATGDVSCDGHPMRANAVTLEHEGGVRSLYWHLAQGSVAVAAGDEVRRGEPLGLVGSSGYSSMPHLHFEVRLADGAAVDPYAGPYSQETSWWCEQVAEDDLPGPCP